MMNKDIYCNQSCVKVKCHFNNSSHFLRDCLHPMHITAPSLQPILQQKKNIYCYSQTIMLLLQEMTVSLK